MSHSPLHQRLHLRLAMRQDVSSPALSPLPPYPAHSPPKEPQELPATAPPSPDLVPGEPTQLVEELDSMRATHVRPRTAPPSPERPSTAYSTRSTIRHVESSPESLSDAFARGFADSGTPALGSYCEPFPPFNPSGSTEEPSTDDPPTMHIPSTEPSTAMGPVPSSLRRGGTPSGPSSPQKGRSHSPQKSRSASPRKHALRTPTLPSHQESLSSAYAASKDPEKWDAPDTPSPVSREQQKQAYAPLQIKRPFAESSTGGEPFYGQSTHARIADYMRKMKVQQRGVMAESSGGGARAKPDAAQPAKRIVASVPHIIQAMAQPGDAGSDPAKHQTAAGPSSAPQNEAPTQIDKQPTRQPAPSRRSETSGASVASKHSIFSTPGRDEMERKKPIVEEDEGPFAEAKSIQDLEQSRRKVSEGVKESGESDHEGKKLCGMKCAVM